MTIHVIAGLLAMMVFISIILIMLILTQKTRYKRRERKTAHARNYLFNRYFDGEAIRRRVSKRFLYEALIGVDEQMKIDAVVRNRILRDLMRTRFMRREKRKVRALSATRRKLAVFYVGRARKRHTDRILFERFKKEKNEAVRLSILTHLIDAMNQNRFDALIETLPQSSAIYQERTAVLLRHHYMKIAAFIKAHAGDTRYEIVKAILDTGRQKFDGFLTYYAVDTLEWLLGASPYDHTRNRELIGMITGILMENAPEVLMDPYHLYHEDETVRGASILALASSNKPQAANRLIDELDGTGLDQKRIASLSRMVYDHREWLDILLRRFKGLDEYKRIQLTKVFVHRLDYIFLKIGTLEESTLKEIVEGLIEDNRTDALIGFLNHNDRTKLEKRILDLIRTPLIRNEDALDNFRRNLNKSSLEKLGLTPMPVSVRKKERPPLEKKKVRFIMTWIVLSFLVVPALYLIRHNTLILNRGLYENFVVYILDVHYYLIAYFAAINTIYVVLLLLAVKGSKRQSKLARTKKSSLLFTEGILPGISIIAPAYNEEKSVIESVTSLLNLKYPSYEVIVVNDGSSDETLSTLVNHFQLERRQPFFSRPLSTKKLRGVYVSRAIPKLIVIDKENGGKADALNLGINAGKYAYVCGIDADSVLEGDALLKLMAVTLDDTRPHLALGGNIYPANGFTFDRGQVRSRGLPKELLPRFQTVEYLRAFTSGRIGWSELRSLMIISGAFGVFSRKDLIETHGYLTSSTPYQKDTVGEDMELVVRLTKKALDEKRPYRVSYVYNAYCYTELPADLTSLFKQRNRWQRGLVDILSYHRDLRFRKRYKQIGFIGYPYFFIFEFMGPFFEIQAYVALIIALFLGLLTPFIVLGIFTAAVVFGIMNTIASLFMIEKDTLMLSRKETVILVFFAILDNLGVRQLISLHRALSTFSALKESGSWGAQKRKGFKKGT